MEVKEEKPMEEQRVREKTIPVFTVLKNGAILKNIFVVNSRDFSSPERNSNAVRDDGDEVEEILLVGRHPDCDILLTHPSISRYHLQIRTVPSLQKLFVTDLSSVHGTWVTDQKVEPDACIEVKEGDIIRIGGSTRIYRLHWIPLSRAYDIDNPFVSPLDASTVMEQDEENRMLEAENPEVAHQSLEKTELVDDGYLHLDVTSEGSGSSVPSEDEDTYITTREILLPLASPRDSVNTQKLQLIEDLQDSSKWDLDVIEAAAEMPTNNCAPSKQQSCGSMEVVGCSEPEVVAEADEWDVRGDLLLNVMSERMVSSVFNEDEDPYLAAKETSLLPLPSDSIEKARLILTEDVQASLEKAVNTIEAKTENPSSGCSPVKGQIDGCLEASGCTAFELAAEVAILSLCQDVTGETEFVRKQVTEASGESKKADIWSNVDNGEVIAVSPNSSPQAEGLLETVTEDARGDLGSEFRSEVSIETDSENLHQKLNEVNPAGDQDTKPGMNKEIEPIFDEGSSLSHSEDLEQSSTQNLLSLANLKPEKETSVGSDRFGDLYNLREIGGDENTDKEVPFPSTLAAETFEDIKPIDELLSTESQENQAQQPHAVRDAALPEMDSSEMERGASIPLLEASGCSAFELAAEVENSSLRQEVRGESGFVTEQVMEVAAKPLTRAETLSHEDNGETEVSRQVIAVSPNSFSQTEPTLTGDARGLLGSELAIETDSENLHEKSNGETKIGSRQAIAVSDCLFGGNERLSRIYTEDIQSLSSSWQPLPKSKVGALSDIWSEKPKGESSIGFERSEESYSLSEMESEGNTDKGSPTLAAETYEDTKPVKEELPSDYNGSQENQSPQTQAVRDNVLSEMDSSRSSPIRLSTCNIWSRRGKATSVLQVRTNSSKGKQKQIGNQPKGQLHGKQALNDKSISLTVHHSAEKLEPEIFTPDKENLTPSSHMLKRLQDVGDIEDSKSSSKLLGKSFLSKIAIVASGALTEPEIFTPDKENLTPNSHMLKRLREVGEIKETKGSSSKAIRKPFFDIHVEEKVIAEQKPDLHSMSSTSKVKKRDEPVATKKKAERAPFQPLLEKSSSQSQSYIEDSSTASARNNISRGMRSSSNLSDGKSKMKWTIVLDTSSLLDKESRKALHLLQGLKGTHLVVPRTVLRELNETKRNRSIFFRGTTEIASSALDWIEECKVKTKWWIQLQSPLDETKAIAPTPPVTPQSNGSAFPLSLHWNHNAPEIDSPTSEDQVLECALLYRSRNIDEKLVLLSNDVTLKIKAMAEGVICETPNEFYESLKNPFSERFMWTESLPRGRTWSHLDDVVLRERYNENRTCFPYRKKKSMFSGVGRGENVAAAKGLKLILLHNSHYGHHIH
ncbi:hypothetical protein EUTSA_v10006568mg [Eutrema salsugineum]|uniref:FHA domain-containing protein n=1 Tax=Eutrema salsugineum TaxID=72664 RepID=V4KTJ3_EUTSA|nr:hypothetical protein EUTSA_v10006568mg [Eutrema salsugineum]